jgi:AmiR/NasT family two-component response regulator
MTATRLVIVNDDPIFRLDLQETLQGLGYEVAGEAADAPGVLAAARTTRPDLVIMDIHLMKPVSPAELRPAIEVTLARFQQFKTLAGEATDLREQLETRKVIERAKGLLMQQQRLSEAEAFRRIQQTSMNTRKSMRAVAEAILLAGQLGA